MISVEMANDVAVLAADLRLDQWSTLVCSPKFAQPGAKAVSSVESASLQFSWVSHAFGWLARGLWASSTRAMIQPGRFSINPLEFLTNAAAVLLL